MVSAGLYWLIALVCAVWIIFDVWTKNKKLDKTKKIIWTVCAVLFSVITAVVYFIVHKAK